MEYKRSNLFFCGYVIRTCTWNVFETEEKSNNVSGYFRVACIIVLGNSFWLNSFHKKSRNKKIRIGAILVMEDNFWNRTSWQISIRESGFVIAGECFKYVSADAVWNAASIHF